MGKLYEDNLYQNMQKKHFWAKFLRLYRYRYRAVPVQPQQKPNCTGIGPSCSGTPQQNATCTGTGQSCTGTVVPKMSRIVYFAYLSLNSHTDCIGTLLND